MSRFRKVVLGAGAAVAIGGAAIAAANAHPKAAGGHPWVHEAAMRDGGWRGAYRGGPGGFGMWCSPRRGEKLERMISFGNAFFNFEGKQETAWKNLTTALHDANADMGKQCKMAKEAKPATTPVERLARVERSLSARLSIIRKVKPAFDNFYGTLNAAQKTALDSLMKRGHHGGWHGHERGDWHGHGRR